ncbi:lipase member H-like [Anopheles aquasalis]|uniref:lipase member H-like n=1 Tax=Anopheles aquasalis TaxID=42839 RepID=UPI00215A8630|nr:lipase member H-like [Anopheles aquasalis]
MKVPSPRTVLVVLATVLHVATATFVTSYDYNTAVSFQIFDWNTRTVKPQTNAETNFASFGCRPADPFVVIVHGWKEGCSTTQWVQETINNFVIHRKGCIICADYSPIASNIDYFTVVQQVDGIARTIEKKVRQLFTYGMTPAKGMLYAFSLGAPIAFQTGRNLAPLKLSRIDACDPVGVGFDLNTTYTALNILDTATNVQCIHTSSDYGTTRRVCQKDWLMGYCGWFQYAAGIKTSHGLCPDFYNAAFWVDFPAIANPFNCPTTRAISSWPTGFKMGYFMPQNNPTLIGDLFAKTSPNYPFN